MKKLSLFFITLAVVIFTFTLVHAMQVFPTSHDFGEVEVGGSITTVISVFNNYEFDPITIDIKIQGSDNFSLVDPPADLIYISPYGSVDIEVAFTPSAEGLASATLVIMNGGVYQIPLLGTGVAPQSSSWWDMFMDCLRELWDWFRNHGW